jgi:hypothetical protein
VIDWNGEVDTSEDDMDMDSQDDTTATRSVTIAATNAYNPGAQYDARSAVAASKQRPTHRRDDSLSSTSCHGKMENTSGARSTTRKRTSSSSRSTSMRVSKTASGGNGSDPLLLTGSSSSSSSVHGAGVSSGSQRRSMVPSNAKDGSGSGAELGASTVHGSTGRRRTTTSGARSSSKRTERAVSHRQPTSRAPQRNDEQQPAAARRMQRAMSTRNVKPPEEYAQGLLDNSRHGSRSGAGTALDGVSSSRHSRASALAASGRSRTQRSESVRAVREKEERRSSSQQHGINNTPQQISGGDDKKSASRMRRSSSVNDAKTSKPRRDLLVLLREEKKITKTDLIDRENRRLLHFLMYEHKMGVSHTELARAIRQQAELGEPVRRKTDAPSLYIESDT